MTARECRAAASTAPRTDAPLPRSDTRRRRCGRAGRQSSHPQHTLTLAIPAATPCENLATNVSVNDRRQLAHGTRAAPPSGAAGIPAQFGFLGSVTSVLRPHDDVR